MATLETLLQQHPIWRGPALTSFSPTVSTGYVELDRQLPGSGWPTGALTEVLGLQEGIGELQLVLPALARLTTAGKRIVWLAPPHLPYAPALAAAGVDLTHLAVVRAPGRRDARCPKAFSTGTAKLCMTIRALDFAPSACHSKVHRFNSASTDSCGWLLYAGSEISPACTASNTISGSNACRPLVASMISCRYCPKSAS